MPLSRYRTRSVPVLAVQYDGANLTEFLDAVPNAHFAAALEIGAWLLIDPDDGRWQILPDSVFQRVYIVDHASPTVYKPRPTEWPRVCFNCVNYSASNEGISFCTLFREVIDSEITEAENCSAYEQWRP